MNLKIWHGFIDRGINIKEICSTMHYYTFSILLICKNKLTQKKFPICNFFQLIVVISGLTMKTCEDKRQIYRVDFQIATVSIFITALKIKYVDVRL